jgi:hypothetical protein
MSSVPIDYICKICGDVCIFFDKKVVFEKNYTTKQIYCPICMTETEHFRLGNKDVVRAQLALKESLEGIDFDVYNLLTTNESRKIKKLVR